MFFSIIHLFCIFVSINAGAPTQSDLDYAKKYGVPIDSGAYTNIPTYGERYMHHYQNIVRVDQDSYRNLGYCTSGYPANYPGHASQKPTWFHPRLIEVARAHGQDLATNCGGLQHNSCDGTSAGARVAQWFPCGMSCENAALGYSYTRVNDGWLCEGSNSNCHVGGHTNNIMSSSSKICGIGVYKSYITQDCSRCSSIFTAETHPIYSGLHVFSSSTKKVKFMAMFLKYSEVEEIEASVVVNEKLGFGKVYEMTAEFGTHALGYHYTVELDATDQYCRKYYFMFKYGGKTFYFPEQGAIVVHNEGDKCKDAAGNEYYYDEARPMVWGYGDNSSGWSLVLSLYVCAIIGLWLL